MKLYTIPSVVYHLSSVSEKKFKYIANEINTYYFIINLNKIYRKSSIIYPENTEIG